MKIDSILNQNKTLDIDEHHGKLMKVILVDDQGGSREYKPSLVQQRVIELDEVEKPSLLRSEQPEHVIYIYDCLYLLDEINY